MNFSFDGLSETVTEESGSAQVLILRSGGSYGDVTVHYATTGITATEGVDYVAAVGELIIPDGSLEQTLNITISDDSLMEPNETFKIELSNITGRSVNLICILLWMLCMSWNRMIILKLCFLESILSQRNFEKISNVGSMDRNLFCKTYNIMKKIK